jgi:16S rRNA (guanine1207-N2)-methyltransferase
MTTILYGRPPLVFDPPEGATQTSPLIPGSAALEDLAPGSVEAAVVYAPAGVLERRYALALALRALRPRGRLDVMAPKDRGGSRLKKELESFGLEVAESAKAHHRRCMAVRPEALDAAVQAAVETGAPRRIEALDAWSQPGVFAWDRVDPGSALLAAHLPPLKGRGADLGCGWGALARMVLSSPAVTTLRLIDIDRRALSAAARNIEDARAGFEWADARTLAGAGDLDFVVTNPPFHDGGTEDRRLGQGFIQTAAAMLRKGGVLWLVANRHLPYEAELNAAFKRVRVVADAPGYKLFEAVR